MSELPDWVPVVGDGCHPRCGAYIDMSRRAFAGFRVDLCLLHHFQCPRVEAAYLEYLCTVLNPNAARNLEVSPW